MLVEGTRIYKIVSKIQMLNLGLLLFYLTNLDDLMVLK